MSEDEEKPKRKENKPRLLTREDFLGQSRALAKTANISDQALKIQMSGIMQAASNYSKAIEEARRVGTLIANYQSPMVQQIIEASKNIDRVLESARRNAEILAGARITPLDSRHLMLLGFSRDLENVGEAIDAIPEELEEEVPELKHADRQELLRQIDKMKTQIAMLVERNEQLEREKQEAKEPSKVKKISKRGPKSPADADKLKALQDWDELDKSIHAVTLAEFLEERFGTEGGVLRVAESTFHGWRQKLRKKGLYQD